jgi:hypothetical protein
MAYVLTYWKAENNGQSALKEYRLKSVQEIPSLILEHQRPRETVLITLTRSDNQSPIAKTVWKKTGYIDPCDYNG